MDAMPIQWRGVVYGVGRDTYGYGVEATNSREENGLFSKTVNNGPWDIAEVGTSLHPMDT